MPQTSMNAKAPQPTNPNSTHQPLISTPQALLLDRISPHACTRTDHPALSKAQANGICPGFGKVNARAYAI